MGGSLPRILASLALFTNVAIAKPRIGVVGPETNQNSMFEQTSRLTGATNSILL